MGPYEIIIPGAAVSGVLGFFLLRLIREHDKTKILAEKTAAELNTLKQVYDLKHDSLGEQIEKLSGSIDKFSEKVDKLTDHVLDLKK